MSFSLTEMWLHMGVPAKVVGAFLMIMGLMSLTVFIERLLALRRSRAAARGFAAEAGETLQSGAVEEVIAEAAKYPQGHLPRLVQSTLTTYWQARHTADGSGLTPLERTRRHVERRLEELGADLRRGMSILASVGSVAPFVGLLGTVVGIITAFQGIAATGSGGLGAVSAGISEALVETALGLVVAIPAVWFYNYLTGRIEYFNVEMDNSSSELLDYFIKKTA
jgi:biopolymer transport protein ExbB